MVDRNWRDRAPWQGIPHPYRGHYGLMALLVVGMPESGDVAIDLGVGPQGRQQPLVQLTLPASAGDGSVDLSKPVNLRDGVPLWFRASDPGVVIAVRAADIVHRCGLPGIRR